MCGWRWTWLTLSYNGEFEVYAKVSTHLLCTMAEEGFFAMAIQWCFALGHEALVRLRAIKWNGLFEYASVMPMAVVHACELSHFNNGPIYTSPFASVATNKTRSDHGGIFVCLSMRTSRGTGFFIVVIESFALSSSSFGSSVRSLMASIGTGLELYWTIFCFGATTTFKKLSMKKFPYEIGTVKLHTTLKTTLALYSPILTRNVIFLTTLTFWFVALFKDVRLFACIAFSHFALDDVWSCACNEDSVYEVLLVSYETDRNQQFVAALVR